MSQVAESFTENVISFCEWAEGDEHNFLEARQHLLTLMQSIPYLESFRGGNESDADFARRKHEGWKEDLKRFADLPFDYYRSVFDPHDFAEKDEIVTGSLCDDLADIYGDLFEGREAYKKGFKKEAIAIWVDSYFYHWGHHASQALLAIDEYYRQNYGCEQGAALNSEKRPAPQN